MFCARRAITISIGIGRYQSREPNRNFSRRYYVHERYFTGLGLRRPVARRRLRMRYTLVILVVAISISVLASSASAGKPTAAGSATISFTTNVLLQDNGSSEPAVAIGLDGTVVYTALSWRLFQTNVWKAPFGSAPVFQGAPDAHIDGAVGGEDADVDFGSTGTLHFSTLMAIFNPPSTAAKLGVSAITCPNADTSNNFANCKAQLIDTNQADRQWVTSDGPTVYISYHDSGSSTLIHVQRSDDDGFTWRSVASPIPGQDGLTGMSTFNNDQGPIVADPTTHSVFPALAVDPSNGKLYASWSDAHTTSFAVSSDHGATWSTAVSVNSGDAVTAVFPWVAAYNGKVDLVYYGTTASSKDDASAVWDTYLAQTTDDGASFTQVKVSDRPNHVGVICTFGTGCARGTRNLLDLFEVAIDPQNGKAVVIFVDDTLTTYTRSDGTVAPLPQVIVAQEA